MAFILLLLILCSPLIILGIIAYACHKGDMADPIKGPLALEKGYRRMNKVQLCQMLDLPRGEWSKWYKEELVQEAAQQEYNRDYRR